MEFGAILGLQDKMTAPLRKAVVGLKKYGKQADDAGSSTDRLGKSTNSLSGSVKKLAASYVTLQGIKAVTRIYAEFEDSMLRVKALVGDIADDEFKALETQAKKLGATTAFSASQVAQAQGNLAQAGQKTGQILNSTTAVLNLASAANLGLSNSADLVSSSLNIFNLNADQAGRVSDVLAAAQANAAGDAQFFGSAIAKVGGSARDMGFSLEATTAVLATLAPSFDDGGSAGTAFNAILRDMVKNQKKLGKAGIEIVNANGSFKDMDTIIKQLTKTTSKMTDIQRKNFLATAFGDEALRGVNALLGENSKNISKYTNLLNDSAGSAGRMAGILESGMGGALRNMRSATEGAAISLGEFLAPAINGVITAVTGVLNIANGFLSFLNGGSLAGDILTSAIWGVSVAMTASKIATLASSGALAGYLSLSGLATIASGVLTGALNLLKLSNPFGWVALAITGIVLLYKRSERFRNLITGIINGFKKLGGFISSIFGAGDSEKTITINTNDRTAEDGDNRIVNKQTEDPIGNTNRIVNNASRISNNNRNSSSTKVDISGNTFNVMEEADIEKIAGQLADEVEKRQGGMKR